MSMSIKFNYDLWQLLFHEIAMNSLKLYKKKRHVCILVLKVHVWCLSYNVCIYMYVNVCVRVVVGML